MATKFIAGVLISVGLSACAATATDDTAIGKDPSSANGATAGDANLGAADGQAAPGASGGATAGDNSGVDPADPDGDGVCMEYVVRNEHATPDMLIVLDRSASMSPNVNDDMVDRWAGSVSGVKSITKQLDTLIQFGLMTFPSDDDCAAGAVKVSIGTGTSGAISTALAGVQPKGNTPTTDSLKAAHQALNALVLAPDQLPRAKYVVLVTDGEPNCRPGELQAVLACGANLGCIEMEVRKTQEEAAAAVTAMAQDGIKTYVLGYQTEGAMGLDQLAQAGDTGDTKHRAVENETALLEEFQRIATKAVSCDFVLEEAPRDPKFVLVQVDGQQLNLGQPNGWSMSADGRRITVEGSACASLQDGKDHVLGVRVLCEVVAPI